MSSLISLNLAPAPQASAKGGSIDANAEADGENSPTGDFSALIDMLLGNADAETADAGVTSSASNTLDVSVGGLVDLNLEASGDVEAGTDGEAGDGGGLLADLIDALTAIETAVSSGQPVDPEVAVKFEAALEAVAAALGINLTAKTDTAVEVSATAGATLPGASAEVDADAAVQAEAMLARLSEKIAALAAKVDAAAAGAANEHGLKAELAAKLEILAKKLGPAAIDAQLLAKLGLDAEITAKDGATTPLTALLATKVEPKPPAPGQSGAVQLDVSALVDAEAEAEAKTAASAKPTLAVDADIEVDAPKSEIKLAANATTEAKAVVDAKQPALGAMVAAAVTTTKDVTTDPSQNGQAALPSVRADLAVNARVVHAAYQAPQAQINLPQMAFEIARHVAGGETRFQIRLDPPELGRVDVKLDIDGNGGINARLTVERSETLDLLQRDQRSLEKALAQAGLDAGKTNLEFSLRQNPFTPDGGNGRGDTPTFTASTGASIEAEVEAANISLYRGVSTAGGVNIFV